MTKQEKGNELLQTLKEIRDEKESGMAEKAEDRPADQADGVNTDDVPKKWCPGCQADYPATKDYFYKDRNTKSGWSSWCKVCKRADVARREGRKPRPVTGNTLGRCVAVDVPKAVLIDFTGHDDLYENLVESAEEEFRTLDQQVLWMVKGYYDEWAS